MQRLHQQLHPMDEQSGALVFRCSETGHEIRSGIWTDQSTLLRIEQSTMRLFCQVCRSQHEFRIANAGIEHSINNKGPERERPVRLLKVNKEVS